MTTPDWSLNLTKKGQGQAQEVGRKIARLLQKEKDKTGKQQMLFSYVSPYVRTMDTLSGALSGMNEVDGGRDVLLLGVREEPRLVEQQFGNFQDLALVEKAKQDRKRFGRFFYRFPNGESGLDVYQRVTSFIATLFRDTGQLTREGVDPDDLTVVIFTHGLTLRLLLMRWFQCQCERT